MFYERKLDLKADSQKKSLFLFGPRQTGKTTLLKKTFPTAKNYNLLLADVFLRVSQHPSIIREELSLADTLTQPVIIDEIQKLPVLLDEIHAMIEDMGVKFILTGSSARKLRRGGYNLLGGRAWTRFLHPLASIEIPDFDIIRALNFGTIPSIYTSPNPEEDLAAYIGNYLQEEIQLEAAVRRIENFSRFLQTASLYNAELVNFSNIGNDAQIPPRTVAEYFGVLEDTLIGTILEPFTRTKKRKAISTAKFYFFDVGVCNFLAGRKSIRPKTELFGKVFEHFIFTELRACLDYAKDNRAVQFWRSVNGQEVDFIIGDDVAIEVKGTSVISERHLGGIRALSEDIKLRQKIIVSMEQTPRRIGDIRILPIRLFLQELWQTKFQ